MIKLFDIIPGFVWSIIVVISLALSGTLGMRLNSERLAHQTTKTQYAEQIASAEKARADEESKRRKAEGELNDAIEKNRTEAQAVSERIERARLAGLADSERLRNSARSVAQRARETCADTTSAAVRETAASAIDVLADVLGRIDKRAGDLAAIADQRGAAGAACEVMYESIREIAGK